MVGSTELFFFFLDFAFELAGTIGRESEEERPGIEEEAEAEGGAIPGMYPLCLAFAIALPFDWYAATSSWHKSLIEKGRFQIETYLRYISLPHTDGFSPSPVRSLCARNHLRDKMT